MYNYSIEAQYPLDIFKAENIPYSWVTIYVGRKLRLLPIKEIEKYAIEYLMDHPECKDRYVAELACDVFYYDNQEINKLLVDVFKSLNLEIINENSTVWCLEWRKWRYCILKSMRANIQDTEKLLDAVSFAYADFGYPDDMCEIVYYMPIEDACIDQLDLGHKRLLRCLDDFLKQERIDIEINNIDSFPITCIEK